MLQIDWSIVRALKRRTKINGATFCIFQSVRILAVIGFLCHQIQLSQPCDLRNSLRS